ncbi:helix-turn-helix domain-containing protein [Acidaminococcus timonensis]|uniref:helix-turn-helix domain-containing protein n=1 Tax=Acidaminococcus timonensis TaxID=1871002 RepID=UPI00294250A9|nr:helix-turn-helix domain-containing protein [Acidaminococcus timonensis]
MESPLMNVKETADYLHVGKSTVYKLEVDGVLHRVKGAGPIRFSRQEVEKTIMDKAHNGWKSSRERELEREIARKDATIQNLRSLLYRLASGVMDGLGKEGLLETERR